MKKAHNTLPWRLLIGLGLGIAVVIVVVVAISLLDSPAQQRLARLDERRIADLREIANAIDLYWVSESRLPAQLADLSDEAGYFDELVDPETGTSYEYRVIDEDTYELCATFSTENAASDRDPYFHGLWQRGIGRQCYHLEARDTGRFIDR